MAVLFEILVTSMFTFFISPPNGKENAQKDVNIDLVFLKPQEIDEKDFYLLISLMPPGISFYEIRHNKAKKANHCY